MWLNWLIKKRLFSARFLCSTVCPSLEAWMAVHPVPLNLTLALPVWKTIDWNRWARFLLGGGGDVRTTPHKPLWCWMPNFQPQSFIFCFSSRWCPAVSSKCASTSNHHASTHLTLPPHPPNHPRENGVCGFWSTGGAKNLRIIRLYAVGMCWSVNETWKESREQLFFVYLLSFLVLPLYSRLWRHLRQSVRLAEQLS